MPTSKLPDHRSKPSKQQPASPFPDSTPTTPASLPVSPGTEVLKETPTSPPPSRVTEHLLNLSVDNKAIASKHRLHPKTRSSVLQAVENWFGGVREPPAEASSRVMVIHGTAGCGKTCVSAELCRRYSGRKQLVAGHFFHWKTARPDHNRAVTFLLGLAYRMCELVKGYVHVQLWCFAQC